MRSCFPLFQSHIDLAHQYWQTALTPGDTAIDATCGNGHDSLVLAKWALSETAGKLIVMDIQVAAITNTHNLLASRLSEKSLSRVHYLQQSHAEFPASIAKRSVKLIVYNLGYLPGGDKSLTTMTDSSLESIQRALELIVNGGVISITCYPGHPEGEKEHEKILALVNTLPSNEWNCCHHKWMHSPKAPSLLLLQRGSTQSFEYTDTE